jgi:beta-lactamase class A
MASHRLSIPALALVACSSTAVPVEPLALGRSVERDAGRRTDSSVEDASAPTDAGGSADAGVPCPPGLGEQWSCDPEGMNRRRCVDGFVRTVTCEFGCTDGGTCSCGTNTSLSTFHCAADGYLHACPDQVTWVTRYCGGRGCNANPVGVADDCKPPGTTLQGTIEALGAMVPDRSPGTTTGIAVRDLVTGESASYRGSESFISASAVKAIWVANALYDTSIAAVEGLVTPVFTVSDNSKAGEIIDLLASPARINGFMWNDVGMGESSFCAWNFDKTRVAGNCVNRFDGNNYFSADDGVAFLTAVWDRSLLGEAKSAKLLEWMTLSPRTGYGGWLGTKLPSAARATMHHKSGSLPPPYTSRVSHEIGIIEIPGAHAYAVGILMGGGQNYDAQQLPALEYASCVIYHAMAKDVADPFAAGC